MGLSNEKCKLGAQKFTKFCKQAKNKMICYFCFDFFIHNTSLKSFSYYL